MRDRNELLRETIRTMLETRAAGAADASAVAAATLVAWQQLAARLEPVIGVRGVDVLFDRALSLTRAAGRPWVTTAGEHVNRAGSLADLAARLASVERPLAIEASGDLLATFTELLATLIGKSLTQRLIGPVLAGLPDSEQETAS